MTTVSIHRPAPVQMPRFAPVAAELFARLLRGLAGVGQALAEMRQAAERQREARELRQFALQHGAHDPRFVADLLAAADRHERNA